MALPGHQLLGSTLLRCFRSSTVPRVLVSPPPATGCKYTVLTTHIFRLVTDTSNSFNLALAFFVPPAFTNIKWKPYMIFGTFCIAMTFHAFFTYPETSRKTLEEVDILFDSNIPAWRSASAGGTFKEKVEEARRTGGLKGVEDDEETAAQVETA